MSFIRKILMIKITNTLTGKKEIFKPLESNMVKMYVCGITPYDVPHIGHGRVAVVFDLWSRLFKFAGFDVMYCRNFTDIDDKLLIKAKNELGDESYYKEIADRYIKIFNDIVKKLNCLLPDYEPRVTDNIPEIISFIEGLIESGHAYVSNSDVYFSIKTFSNYGKLSKQDFDRLRTAVRVEVSAKKQDPLDFVLWKGNAQDKFWKSPWGHGRPGWHIECSVLAYKFLGKQIDIHGGGMDLIFPHHENEVAQSESLHKKNFAKYWVHNAFVTIDKEKMSKSLGNFFTLEQVFEYFDPIVVRYYLLSNHYRTPFDFSYCGLSAVKTSYKRLVNVFSGINAQKYINKSDISRSVIVKKMLAFLYDDLNTSGMLGVVFEHVDDLKNDFRQLCAVKYVLQEVFGLPLIPLKDVETKITPKIQQLIDERNFARKDKNWKKADEIRKKLIAMGVVVCDDKT